MKQCLEMKILFSTYVKYEILFSIFLKVQHFVYNVFNAFCLPFSRPTVQEDGGDIIFKVNMYQNYFRYFQTFTG